MDDLSTDDEQLEKALGELRWVNRLLGGYRAIRREILPLLRAHNGRRLTILDLGTGIGDYPEHFVRWGTSAGVDIRVTAVDANPATVSFARRYLDGRLPDDLSSRIEVVSTDALQTSFPDGAFDVATASLFLHHFRDEDAVNLLREMSRLATRGIVVNDLHRHILAYGSIKALSAMLPVSAMFRHDGPLSVRRAFTKHDLEELARAAGLKPARIRWMWAFRWVLSTIRV